MATSLRQVVLYVLIVHWTVVVAVVEEQKTHGDVEKHGNNNNVVQQTQDLTSLKCLAGDTLCETDHIGFEAIAQLHSQIDDDQDGIIDRPESAGFIKEDLKLDGGSEIFHGSDDFISVHELWQMWIRSPVYNWTIDNVITWLSEHVELSQYVPSFKANAIEGRALPRLASNYLSFLSTLGIKNPVHKQKLSIKATDVVLFGPPKGGHNFIKDIIVAVSVIVAVGGCYFAYTQHRRAQVHVQRLMKDLSSLQNAEDTLSQMHQQLEQAQTAQRMVADDKQDLERQLEDIGCAKAEAERLRQQREMQQEEEFSQLKLAEEELVQVRRALCEAERQLEVRQQMPFADLQQWLQLTYEIETKYFEEKRHSTEKQLINAKDMCDKIRKQKGKFLGSFRVAHTTSLDETDNKIMSVRAALEDIKVELQERTQRWKKIEKVCGFNVIMNPGIPYLNSILCRSSVNSLPHSPSQNKFFDAEDNDDDEIASAVMPHTLYGPELRDRRTIVASSSSSLSSQPSLHDVRHSSPSMHTKFSQQQPTSSGSEDSLSSLDKKSIFEFGSELRTEERPTTRAASRMVKSVSDPVRQNLTRHDQTSGRVSPFMATSMLHVPPANESEVTRSPSAERKKKSAFSKLLHPSKQKTP